jgi:hypothetical protein
MNLGDLKAGDSRIKEGIIHLKRQRDLLLSALKTVRYQLTMAGGDPMPTMNALINTVEADKSYPPEVF